MLFRSLDSEISAKLKSVVAANGKIALVSGTIHSPSTLKAIEAFKGAYPTAEHVTYDAVSYSGMLEANASDFGQRALPSYNFGNAKVIVSFGADFLGTWISPVEYSKEYTKNRQPNAEGGMSKHIQFESAMSMTGTNADHRFPMRASQEALYVATLYNYIAMGSGARQIPVPQQGELAGNSIKKTAEALLKAKRQSLVISGSNSTEIQQIVNGINMLLESYGNTIDMVNHSNQYQGSDIKTSEVLAGLKSGAVGAVIFYEIGRAHV